MAIIEAAAGSHKWESTEAWIGGKVPEIEDDVVLGKNSGELLVNNGNQQCRSVHATTEFKGKVECSIFSIEVGAPTANSENFLIRWEGGTFKSSGNTGWFWSSTNGTVQTVSTVEDLWNVRHNHGKVELASTLKLGEGYTSEGAQPLAFKMAGHTLTIESGLTLSSSHASSEFNMENTVIAVKGTEFAIESAFKGTFAGTGGTIELKGSPQFFFQLAAGSYTYPTVKLSAKSLETRGSVKVAKLITEQTIVGSEIKVQEGDTIEIQSIENKNTVQVKVKSTAAAKPWHITKASGTLEVEKWELTDSHAEGEAKFVDANGKSISGNTGWEFLFRERFAPELKFSFARQATKITRNLLAELQATFSRAGTKVRSQRKGELAFSFTRTASLIKTARKAELKLQGIVPRIKQLTAELKFTFAMKTQKLAVAKLVASLGFTNPFKPINIRKILRSFQVELPLEGYVKRHQYLRIHKLLAELKFSPHLKRATRKGLAASLTFARAQKPVRQQLLKASLTFARTLRRSTKHPLVASLNPSGAVRRGTERIMRLAARLGFTAREPITPKPPPPLMPGQVDYVFLKPQPANQLVVNVASPWPLPVIGQTNEYPELTFVSIIRKDEVESDD